MGGILSAGAKWNGGAESNGSSCRRECEHEDAWRACECWALVTRKRAGGKGQLACSLLACLLPASRARRRNKKQPRKQGIELASPRAKERHKYKSAN